jgi:hypothetical protein
MDKGDKVRVQGWSDVLWASKSMDLYPEEGDKMEDQRTLLAQIRMDVSLMARTIDLLEQRLAAEKARANAADDVAVLMCDRAGVSPDEAAQLGVAALVRNDAGDVVGFKRRSIQDALTDDGTRAGEVKFRQLKQHFRDYQNGVKALLFQLDGMARKNTLSTKDLNTLLDVREQIGDVLRREF